MKQQAISHSACFIAPELEPRINLEWMLKHWPRQDKW